MSHRAWAYVFAILVAGAALVGVSLTTAVPVAGQWKTFAVLTLLAVGAHLFEATAPKHQRQSYYPTLVFWFAGVWLLHPFLFVLLVIIPHLVEWAYKRLAKSSLLRQWYLQPFNMAMYIIAGFAAHWVYILAERSLGWAGTAAPVLAMGVAALAYVFANHLIIGQALVLARGVPWRDSGILDIQNLLTEYILLALGGTIAQLWALNPWWLLPALAPLVLMYRALWIPQLKEQAQTDSKTGLWNAAHFTKLAAGELERAHRFDRPLTVMVADLDLLRNINNTYGHLAGDEVLAGVGRIIRSTIRDYDIAGRFGGEEFAIVLPEAGPEEALAIAERLRVAIEAAEFAVATSTSPLRATISCGLACFPADAITLNDLIHEADVAVYQAKLRGRNCIIRAADVPHYVRPEEASVVDRTSTPYAAAFMPRRSPPPGTAQAAPPPAKPDPAPKPPKSEAPGAAPVKPPAAPANAASRQLKLFVAAVIATGVGVAAAGFGAGWMSNPLTLVLLFGLALAAELMQIDLYGENTVSVSVAINFSAALIAGIPGVVCASAAIALAHAIRKRPALYKAVFNWAGYVLAQTPLLAVGLWAGPLDINRLPLLAPLVALAALACYAINTGLVAIAISLSERRNPLTFWRRQFQWLAGHYLVLGIVGLFLALAHLGFGLAGMLVFVLPVFMLRYAQKQYVERTQASMCELRRMNEELGAANQDAVGAALAIQKLNKHLEELNDELFETLARIIDARDPFVSGHAAKVVDYAVAIATELGLPPEHVRQVRQAAFLHDVGKIAISEEVLHKPGKLTAEEYEYMKSHAARGAELLETSQGLRHLAPFVRHHHERWDGRGYPHGLRGDEIPLEARIIAICDSVEAMASDRPYSRAKSLDEIVAEVARYRGTQFDPQIADVFLRIAQQQGDKLVVNSARQVVEQRRHDEVLLRQHDGWFGAQPRLDAASRG